MKLIVKSPELASLNETLADGDQPLSTYLILSPNFGAHLFRDKPAYIVAKVVPHSKKQFMKRFWYEIFNLIQKNEIYLFSIEEKVLDYPVALVKKVLVKPILPESSWLRIQ
ncbi:MAG: hypothetical protein ACTSQI_10475 [Candidatus Helarchaeota archaeon]